MKKKEKNELISFEKNELIKLRDELRKQIADFKINRYTKQPKNVRSAKIMRKKLAVVLGLIRQKEL